MTPYYEEKGITIFHGDCREILPTLEPVDLVLTDPPYGINFAGQPTKWQRLDGAVPTRWDEHRIDDLYGLIRHIPLKAIWGGNYYQLPVSRGWLTWFKPDAPPSMGNVELCWTNRTANTRQITYSISATNSERLGHPTQKPLAVIKWTLAQFVDPTSLIDPFMGSGTTLQAAKDNGLPAIGIEIEERYCEIAANRLAQNVFDFSNNEAAPPNHMDEAALDFESLRIES